MKKGFTLIELLAVIVILAIIALIATPIILNIIDTTREAATKRSVEGYLEAVENRIMQDQLKNETKIPRNGVFTSLNEVKVDGSAPSSGWILTSNGKIDSYSLYVNGYTVTKIDGEREIVEGENIAEQPVVPLEFVCRRALELHEETCTSTDTSQYCRSMGYYVGGPKNTTTIEYGNLGKKGENPVSGDAFDCDVDGNNIYDADERFYYIRDLDNETAVLIYYNNTIIDSNGVAVGNNTSLNSISSHTVNNLGPVSEVVNLPTVNDWKNVKLKNITREITNEDGGNTTNNGSLTIVSHFTYKNSQNVEYAARLLNYDEIKIACNDSTPTTKGDLKNCEFLLENTTYSSSGVNAKVSGYWLETPYSLRNDTIYAVDGADIKLGSIISGAFGVRPAIEVPKEDIDY